MGLKWRGTKKIWFFRINMTQKGVTSISERYGPITYNSRTEGWRMDLPWGFHHIFDKGSTGEAVLNGIRNSAMGLLVSIGLAILGGLGYLGYLLYAGTLPWAVLLLPLVLLLFAGKSKPKRRRRRSRR